MPGRINNTDQLQGLAKYAKDPAFQAKWRAVKRVKKAKLAALITTLTGDADINMDSLFDVQVGQQAEMVHGTKGRGRGLTGLGKQLTQRSWTV